VNLAAVLRLRLMRDQAAEVITFAVDGLMRVLDARRPYTLAAAMADEVLLADKGDFAKAERYRSSFGSIGLPAAPGRSTPRNRCPWVPTTAADGQACLVASRYGSGSG
jgi:hypothetical protein